MFEKTILENEHRLPSDVLRGCGVYRIYNSTNGRSYVGLTKSLPRRRKEHLRLLGRGEHHKKELQVDYDRGHDLSFEVLFKPPARCISDANIYLLLCIEAWYVREGGTAVYNVNGSVSSPHGCMETISPDKFWNYYKPQNRHTEYERKRILKARGEI